MKKTKLKNSFACMFYIVLLYFILICFYLVKMYMNMYDAPNYQQEYYVVQQGDTLWGIAEENASDTQDIREWIAYVKEINEMETSEIKSGDEITILKESK